MDWLTIVYIAALVTAMLAITTRYPKGDGVRAIYAIIINKTAMVINPSITLLLILLPFPPKRSIDEL
jgi:uncharacterized membrane protein YozB (DUF420 family)